MNVAHIPQHQAAPTVLSSVKPLVVATSAKNDASLVQDSDSESDLSELSDGSISDFSDSDESSDLRSMTPAEKAEHETFGHDYKGPVFADEDASRLLILMAHASTCPCR